MEPWNKYMNDHNWAPHVENETLKYNYTYRRCCNCELIEVLRNDGDWVVSIHSRFFKQYLVSMVSPSCNEARMMEALE